MATAGAFFYLTACTIKNSVRVRVKRLRQPRYLIVTIVGLLYFVNYVVLFRGVRYEPGGDNARLSFGDWLTRWGVSLELLGCLILLLILSLTYLLTTGRRPALDFSRADIQFLFPAPVTRRQLLHYKLLRSQIGALLGSAFFAVLLRPGGSAGIGRFWIGLWIVVTAIELHLIAVQFAENSLAAHGRTGWLRQRTTILVVLAVMVVLAWTIVLALPALAAMTTVRDVFAELDRLTSTGAAGVVLWPIRALVRLPLAPSAVDFMRALPWALFILALKYVWVLRADEAFEEASAAQAEIHAKTPAAGRRRRIRKRKVPFRLRASGPPEVALLWKNLTLTRRQAGIHAIAMLIPLVGILIALLATDVRRSGLAAVIAILCLALAMIVILTGPFSTRNDLRHDLANLALLKTWPLRGATLFRGAVLAPTVTLSAILILLIVTSAILFGYVTPTRASGIAFIRDRFVYAGVAVLLAPAIVLAQVVIQNAFAVMFPAWVTIGPARGRGGIEMMGQQMVMMFGGMFALALALIPAAFAATVTGFGLYWATGMVPLIPGAAAAAAAIVIECWAATEIFGLILDKTDVGAVDAPSA
jgi:hypothetical protein